MTEFRSGADFIFAINDPDWNRKRNISQGYMDTFDQTFEKEFRIPGFFPGRYPEVTLPIIAGTGKSGLPVKEKAGFNGENPGEEF